MTATAGVESATLRWDPVAAANSYNVYWSAGPGVSKAAHAGVASAASSPFIVGNLTFGVTYSFVVTSVAGPADESAESAPEASAFILRPAAPQAGSDIEQYFDGGYNDPGASAGRENYDDRSRHPLTNGTTPAALLWGGTENCLGCHGGKSKSGGAKHYSNECLKCHFENQPGTAALDGARHGNGVIELATITGNGPPASQYTVASVTSYDAWCLQCHSGAAGVTLGGIAPSGRTSIDPAAVQNGRHRLYSIGCIYCHHPHGRTNTRNVRENPYNRRTRGAVPVAFGVYPDDTTGNYANDPRFLNQSRNYRSRVDNNYADAADENSYCNASCHRASYDDSYGKERMILRDNTTANYMLTPGFRKIYLVNGVQYTKDNGTTLQHVHPNGEIIATDDMVRYYAGLNNISGPSFYKYPGGADANPAAFSNAASPLPFFPEYGPGSDRSFVNAYDNTGLAVRYRFTCSTCHDPHGTTLPNSAMADGYPDLRERKANPIVLCVRCHR